MTPQSTKRFLSCLYNNFVFTLFSGPGQSDDDGEDRPFLPHTHGAQGQDHEGGVCPKDVREVLQVQDIQTHDIQGQENIEMTNVSENEVS